MATDPQPERDRAPSPPEDPTVPQGRSWLPSRLGQVFPTNARPTGGALARGELLWGLVVLAMGLDVALTGVGLSLGLQERNPVALAFIERFGLVGAGLVLKGLVLGVGVANWLLLPWLFPTQRHRRYLIPLALALPSWGVVGFNAVLVLTVL